MTGPVQPKIRVGREEVERHASHFKISGSSFEEVIVSRRPEMADFEISRQATNFERNRSIAVFHDRFDSTAEGPDKQLRKPLKKA